LSGKTVAFSATRKFYLNTTSYTQTGNSALFTYVRKLISDYGIISLTGNSNTFQRGVSISAVSGTYQQAGGLVTFTHNYPFNLGTINYLSNGYAARLYESTFFYTDSEIIYVPQEINTILIDPAVVDAGITIEVPFEVQTATLDYEDRTIIIPVNDNIEELTEYRESLAESRLRVPA
jgi:hypothetical protein